MRQSRFPMQLRCSPGCQSASRWWESYREGLSNSWRAGLAASGPGVQLVGVYGCEWIEDGEVRRATEVQPWTGPVAEVLTAAGFEAPAGVGVEDKGASVTLHWRGTPEAAKWASAFAATWAARTGLMLQPGRMAIELRPPVDLDKGRVVERLAQRCTAACFVGDDLGDLVAFAALDRLAAQGMRTVRVAVADEESPPSSRVGRLGSGRAGRGARRVA